MSSALCVCVCGGGVEAQDLGRERETLSVCGPLKQTVYKEAIHVFRTQALLVTTRWSSTSNPENRWRTWVGTSTSSNVLLPSEFFYTYVWSQPALRFVLPQQRLLLCAALALLWF